jgi:ABC-type glycerol-3-phosphate transport system substrate-binding protein
MSLVKSLLPYLLPVLALTACERVPEIAGGAVPRPAITLLYYFTGALDQNTAEVKRLFNAQNPRYELKPMRLQRESFKSSVQDSLKFGQPADLYSSWAGEPTAAMVPDLEPLDDVWQAAKLDARFPPEVVRAASVYQGHKYLLPLTRYDVMFIYNKHVFASHNLKPPSNWNEFLSACATLKAKGVTPIALGAKSRWPTQLWFDMLLLRTAPLEFRQRLMQGRERYDDPHVKAVFARWASLFEKGYVNPDASELTWFKGAIQMVLTGKAAMTLTGGWSFDYFKDDAQHGVIGKDYDVFPFPRINADLPQVSLGSIDGLVLPKRSTNKQGAKELLAYLAEPTAQQAFTRDSGALAPSTQVPRNAYSDVQQQLVDIRDHSGRLVFLFDLSTPSAVAESGLDAMTEFVALPKSYPMILNRFATSAAAYFKANPPP